MKRILLAIAFVIFPNIAMGNTFNVEQTKQWLIKEYPYSFDFHHAVVCNELKRRDQLTDKLLCEKLLIVAYLRHNAKMSIQEYYKLPEIARAINLAGGGKSYGQWVRMNMAYLKHLDGYTKKMSDKALKFILNKAIQKKLDGITIKDCLRLK